ncbi:hypothetical protein P2G88_06255 [Aliiglaciecola sp. CAU 1673]|uniref:hypothetical protein n=1 Tax=Aliiglaciecola sp. CAU 1673 TaxID=3032595 RepID=UPI0023DBBB3D|nr:hypothetical protein [Aliiglaciecola sp. CAU 1673]MDF2177848.1 hypothetical protein [Aliiglaciecola sp. CAU 1673]
MKEHGTFSLTLIDKTVHSYPIDSFNQYGIERYRDAVLAMAACLNQWLLFEHPRNLAALTPDGLKALGDAYRAFEKAGCEAIAVEVAVLFKTVIERELAEVVKIPLMLDDSEARLSDFLSAMAPK